MTTCAFLMIVISDSSLADWLQAEEAQTSAAIVNVVHAIDLGRMFTASSGDASISASNSRREEIANAVLEG